jgi:hypothetical protein
VVTKHEEKEALLLQHFRGLMGTSTAADVDLNWEALNINSADLSHLDAPFSLEQLKGAVNDLHAEKAPGPDGFIGGFFKKCWHISRPICLQP